MPSSSLHSSGVPSMDTPAWIAEHCAAHDGGWAIPVQLVSGHPGLEGAPRCLECEDRIVAGDVVIPQPFNFERWTLIHRACLLNNFGTSTWGPPELPKDSAGLIADAVMGCVAIGLDADRETVAKLAHLYRFLQDPTSFRIAVARLGRRVGLAGTNWFDKAPGNPDGWWLHSNEGPPFVRLFTSSTDGISDLYVHVPDLRSGLEPHQALALCLAATEPKAEPSPVNT